VKHWKETAEVFGKAVRLAEEGRRAALATVVGIDGSAYRRPGAKLLVEEDGRTVGSISGGCLEGDVREIALEAMGDGQPRRRRYDTREGENAAWGLGLGCAGSVDVFLQPASGAGTILAFERALERFEDGRPFLFCTVVSGPGAGAPPVVIAADGTASGSTGVPALDREIGRQTGDWLAGRTSALRTLGGSEIFAEVLVPAPRLLVFGADDDAMPLCASASAVGFRVTVVDHRPAFVTSERFPSAERRVALRPEDGVEGLAVGPRTFAVVKTHLIAHDREWARRLLGAGAEHVGLLGPRARTREIVRQIGAEGDGRVFGPVGLDLCAEGPEQVALSIVAELLAASAGVEPRHLRDKPAGVHAT
jgi:xanthine dehydrogenase accessory factor